MHAAQQLKFRQYMAVLAILAAFLFQLRLGAVPTETVFSGILAQDAIAAQAPKCALTQSDSQSVEQHDQHQHSQTHADHGAHCLFCFTQAFGVDVALPLLLLPEHLLIVQRTWHTVDLPLFVAFYWLSRAPPLI